VENPTQALLPIPEKWLNPAAWLLGRGIATNFANLTATAQG
jgi:hypothetical protein